MDSTPLFAPLEAKPATSSPTMTATDVRASLALRWPDSEYLSIAEAPTDSSRQGRRLDLLVVSLWHSRGLELDGIEIKVSLSDWKRELKSAEKADFWWRHTHRFWVAVPKPLAARVADELPAGWGLLACEHGKSPRAVVKAAVRTAEPLPWATCVGLMRAAADAGLSALHRAEARGRALGLQQGKEAAERRSADSAAVDALQDLREQVRQFEEASGVSLSDRWENMTDLGRQVAIVRAEMRNPGWLALSLGGSAQRVIDDAQRVAKQAEEIRRAAEAVSAALAAAAAGEEA